MNKDNFFHQTDINKIKYTWLPDNEPDSILIDKYTFCECGKKILTKHLQAHLSTIYHISYENARYSKNKDILTKPEKHQCNCGCLISKTSISNHIKSKKHYLFLDILKKNYISIP